VRSKSTTPRIDKRGGKIRRNTNDLRDPCEQMKTTQDVKKRRKKYQPHVGSKEKGSKNNIYT